MLKSRVEAHSPMGILKQGFAYITKDSKLVSKAKNLKAEDKISIRFFDGSVQAEITNKKE